MKKDQFIAITEWQNKTFGKATALSKVEHLKEELKELSEDLQNDSAVRRLEFADCFILLFGAASSDGMTYEDICACIDEKFSIVQKRKWGQPDENGVVKHLKE